MARKSRKNMMPLEATALPDKEKKVLFKAGLYARLSHETELLEMSDLFINCFWRAKDIHQLQNI